MYFHYLQGIIDLGLCYSIELMKNLGLVDYKNLAYISDLDKACLQTGYVFIYNGTMISWKSVKQTLVATSSNHYKILALHEASKEFIWLPCYPSYPKCL